MRRPVTRDFPVSVTLRASLAKAASGRRKAA
jgi:LacI family transcriptional regulator